MTLSDLMISREAEEDNVGVSEQLAEPVNSSKQNTGLELQIMCPLLLNIEIQESNPQPNKKSEELKQVQQCADLQEQFDSTLIEEHSNPNDKLKTNPLWSMHFDGSCTNTNAGAGVWI